MCYYEEIHFVSCGHKEKRLQKYCHFARNDPGHQCFGAWNIRQAWEQHETECENCAKHRQYLQANGLTRNVQPVYGVAGGR
jgi:hypothetical protein